MITPEIQSPRVCGADHRWNARKHRVTGCRTSLSLRRRPADLDPDLRRAAIAIRTMVVMLAAAMIDSSTVPPTDPLSTLFVSQHAVLVSRTSRIGMPFIRNTAIAPRLEPKPHPSTSPPTRTYPPPPPPPPPAPPPPTARPPGPPSYPAPLTGEGLEPLASGVTGRRYNRLN